MNLTKRTIDALKPPEKGYTLYWDSKLPGFGVRVTSSGMISFVLNYRVKGRERRYTIGRYGEITPTKAREEAMRIKSEVRGGTDPLADRAKGRNEPTFYNLADEYERVWLPRKKSSSALEDKRLIKRLRLQIGSRKLFEINRRTVEAIHQKKGATAPYEANRTLALLSKMFSLAIQWEWMEKNPAKHIERFKENKRDRFVKEHELPRLMESIQAEPDPYIRGFFLLLLLTGARRFEVLTMRREDIDFEVPEWRIPDTKAGRVHVLPLPDEAVEVIQSLPRILGNPYVIIGRNGKTHLKEPAKAWQRIKERANLKDVRLHDLRRTVGSYMAMSGASLPLIGKVLNHSNPSTTSIYARFTDDAPRAALEAVASTIMNASSKPVSPKVVPIHKKSGQ